jgi:hypothetical protein
MVAFEAKEHAFGPFCLLSLVNTIALYHAVEMQKA